jgi:hypothetical protein
MRAGYGHCTHGLPLEATSPHRYSAEHGTISFTIQDDGSLQETRDGEVKGRYAKLDGQICGAHP